MRRLLHFDEAPPMETPLILLGALREIDPTIELVHFGIANPQEIPAPLMEMGGVWQDWRLGSVRPSPARTRAGETMLDREDHRDVKNMRNVLLGRLALQGFAQIARYLSRGVPTLAPTYDDQVGIPVDILEDLTFRDHEYRRNQGLDVMAMRLDETEGGPGRRAGDAMLREKLHTDGRDEYRRGKRGAIITNLGIGG